MVGDIGGHISWWIKQKSHEEIEIISWMSCWCSKLDNKDIPRCQVLMIWTCTMHRDSPGGGAEAETLNTHHMGLNMPSQARSPRSPHWGMTMAYLGSTTTRRHREKSNGRLNYFCHMLFLMSINRSNWTLSSVHQWCGNKMVPSHYCKYQTSSWTKCS